MTPGKIEVRFFMTEGGDEPVREWLKNLPKEDRATIGEDIRTVQFGWPLGMPLVRKLEPDLWEVRVDVTDGIGRVFFTMSDNMMLLLHGFKKKSQKTPQGELELARQRLKKARGRR